MRLPQHVTWRMLCPVADCASLLLVSGSITTGTPGRLESGRLAVDVPLTVTMDEASREYVERHVRLDHGVQL